MKAMYAMNEKLNGIEITFEGKPSDAIRQMMKDNGYRWHRVKQLWYAKHTELREEVAKKVCEDVKDEKPEKKKEKKAAPKAKSTKKAAPKKKAPKKKAPKTDHHFKVGDVLVSSWGYEQTNLSFYQVVAVNGKTMVTVKPVRLKVNESEAMGPMSEDVSFFLPDKVIADEDAEPMKRKVVNLGKDAAGEHVNINEYQIAHKYDGRKLYRSWYA